jgi:hypothetical protein
MLFLSSIQGSQVLVGLVLFIQDYSHHQAVPTEACQSLPQAQAMFVMATAAMVTVQYEFNPGQLLECHSITRRLPTKNYADLLHYFRRE